MIENNSQYPSFGDIVSVQRKKDAEGNLLSTVESFHVYELEQTGEQDKHFVKWSNALDRKPFLIPSSFWTTHGFTVTGKHSDKQEKALPSLNRKETIEAILSQKNLIEPEKFSAAIEKVMGFGVTSVKPSACTDEQLIEILKETKRE